MYVQGKFDKKNTISEYHFLGGGGGRGVRKGDRGIVTPNVGKPIYSSEWMQRIRDTNRCRAA